MAHLPPPTQSFTSKKTKILSLLSVPDEEYTDASPKGSVDAPIRDLIDQINLIDGFVTTSSCSGRASVFLEGSKHEAVADDSRKATVAGVGGKGGGGTWLYVSHDPFPDVNIGGDDVRNLLFGLDDEGRPSEDVEERKDDELRLVHFKFEPMILHVLTASPQHANLVLSCALQAGFRESGAINIIPPPPPSSTSSTKTPTTNDTSPSPAISAEEPRATPIVGIRSMGLGFESLIGHRRNGKLECTVSTEYLSTLVGIANQRFVENRRRIERFRSAFETAIRGKPVREGWEDAEARRARKRAEGLRLREQKLEERLRAEDGGDLQVGDS